MKNQRAFSDILFIAIIFFLAFASVVSYLRTSKKNEASNLVAHANLFRFKLGQTLSFVRAAEKKEQDSIRARMEDFNSQLQKDSAATYQMVRELDSLTRDDSNQRAGMSKLHGLLQKRLVNLHAEHMRAENIHAALFNFVSEGESIVNRIQLLFVEMRHIQDDLLLQKIQEKDRAAFLTPLYSLVLSLLAIIIVTGAYFRLRSETRLRLQAEDGQAIIHNFFHQAPAMLAILKGPDHIFEFINQPFQELIGNRNPINLPVRKAIPEATGQGYFEIMDSVYQTGEPFIGKEMPLMVDRGKGLNPIFINIICQVLRNAAGDKEGVLVFCYDVSEQVLARNQLQEAESRSRLAIEAARMGTFDWDLQNEQFISSEKLVEIFGYHNAAAVTHQDLLDRFHPEDKPIRDEAVKNSYNLGSLRYEARVIWPDKTTHWINVVGKILTDDAKNILRMYGTVVDVTPQKIALEELKESEAKFRLLANALPQQIWTAGKNGRLSYFNEAVYDFTGLNFTDMENKGWVSIVHPDEIGVTMKKWSVSVKTGNEFFLEHRFKNIKGEYRWQLSRAIPQKDKQGNIQMWIGTSTDIHDQKNFMEELERKVVERTQSLNAANLALKQSVNELEQTNAELASFNYIASHDLQEPLRKIIAFSKRIEEMEKETLSVSSRDYFDRIIHATMRMQNLINAFLSYSQTNNFQGDLKPTDLNIVYHEVKNDFTEAIVEKNITMECQPLPVLPGIPLQINQLFTNLIGNAIKYVRTDANPKIEISAEEQPGQYLVFDGVDGGISYWKISIRDNGIGFNQKYENQIFELFQRLHSREVYEGTGIGLAICKKIMRNHKGFISATGEDGAGAVFSMYFPSL
jgi:PAS domain S-box-containing protein